jgi:spermidine/putrescine transport system substrate-binding protein
MAVDLIKRLEEAKDRFMNGDLGRREFLKIVGMAGVSAGLLSLPVGRLTPSALAAKKSVRFDGWGGVTSEAFSKHAFKPFTEATGVEVIEGEFGDEDTYLTRVKASFPPGGEFNLFHASGLFDYKRYIDLDFGVVLDESKIPNLKNVMDAMIKPYRALSNGTLSAVPYDYGQTAICYNSKHIPKEKAESLGVKLLWDKSLEGKLASAGSNKANIWYAALYTGQHPNDIKDLDAVWNALREQRKLIKKYWSSGAELMSLLGNEEVYATVAWSGRVANLQKQGHPIELMLIDNGYSWQECIFVIKGSDLDVAHELLNFMLEPECAIAVAIAQNYPPSLDPTKVEMPEAVKTIPTFDPTGQLKGFLWADPPFWNSNQVKFGEMWDRIKAGG